MLGVCTGLEIRESGIAHAGRCAAVRTSMPMDSRAHRSITGFTELAQWHGAMLTGQPTGQLPLLTLHNFSYRKSLGG